MLRFVHVTVISGHIASSAAGVWYLPKVYSSWKVIEDSDEQ